MKQLPGPSEIEPTTGISTSHREVIGSQVDLPGRYSIITDGQTHNLDKSALLETSFGSQDAEDARAERAVTEMVRRILKAARAKLKKDGRNPMDWKYTVMIAVHHKGQATDFWFGDGPEKETKVDQSLPENLHKPINGQRVKIEKR